MAEYSKDEADADDVPGKPEPGSDAAILEELRERFDYAATQWGPIIREADVDVRYAAGDTWDKDDRTARAGRPILNLDQLSQYTNQLVNSFRQNPRGAKVSPAGGGATEQTAELRANRIRQIEYDSHAQEVYTVAGENAATRGYGYARIVAEYEDSTSDNQVLRLKSIPNPNQVLPDPDGESTSGADWQYLFFIHTVTKREFARDYPDATIKDFDAPTMALAPRWFGKDGRVQIAEYWYVTETAPKGGKGRPTRTVCMYLTNGVELLQKPGYPKKTEWPGSSIPFAMAAGKIVYQTDAAGDSVKMYQSYIRLARDAAKAYNWTASTKLEALALPVKASLMGYKGQADNDALDKLERSTREPIAWIEFAALTELTGAQVLPLPQYATRVADISGYEIAGESFRRDIQNALGRYSAQDHRLGSTKVTSGVALKELDKSGDLGSFHFVAHYDDMIRELAVKLDELLPHYDDAAKEVNTRLPDGSTKRVPINQMTGKAPNGTPMYGPKDLQISAEHRHTVTISTGPSFDSQRAEGKDAALTLLANPVAFPIIASDAVKLMDLGPIGDQMSDDLKFIQPQAMQQARAQKEGGGPDPAQLMNENAQLKQQVQHAEGVMQQQDQDLKGKQAEIASKEKIAMAELQFKAAQAAQDAKDKQADREVKLAVAELSAKTKDMELFVEERTRLGVQEQAAADRMHEAFLHKEKLDHAERLAEMQRQTTLEAADKAARASRSVQVNKGPDGETQSLTITGDAGMSGGVS
jgi:hypothetical protein